MSNSQPDTNISKVLIVRYGEVALKGTNKPYFERILIQRIRSTLSSLFSDFNLKIGKDGGLIIIRGDVASCKDELTAGCRKVFGVASVSYALAYLHQEKDQENAKSTAKQMENIGNGAVSFLTNLLPEETRHTFKIETKRADKSFPLTSPEVSKRLGEIVLDKLGDKLTVDVHKPDILLTVHIKPKEIFFYDEKSTGFGGLPVGTNGRGLVLLSGGIDSPVAAWMMAKRGMRINALHFMSYPFTSPQALEKVKDLAKIIAGYTGEFKLYIINLLPIQERIKKSCPEEEGTIITRWFMMRLGEKIAYQTRSDMLITGESLGQVASQTAEAIVVTDASVSMPIMRPLIGMDKVDIMKIARDIGTYDTSILPYEDCCTVFLPKHPKTRPVLTDIRDSIAKIRDAQEVASDLISGMEVISIDVN